VKAIFLLTWVLISLSSYGQIFHSKINEYSEKGERIGRWIEYFGEDNKIISSEVHYRNGAQSGICKFYHSNGNIRLKWHYYKNRIRAKYYSESGQLEQKGWSKLEGTDEETHYYWHGKWKFFDKNGKLIRRAVYEYGAEVESNETL